MKTVKMERDFSYRAMPRAFVQYLGGVVYERVPEAAVRAIIAAKAGVIVLPAGPIEND
jgi:hypothetical protein